jgi:hypothetical protein
MTAKSTKPAANDSVWGADVEELDGVAPINKAELLGIPFLLTGLWFETNKSGIEYAWLEGRYQNGDTFLINDSSTGIRAQMEQYLLIRGKTLEPGEIMDLKILVPKGLRVSEYDVTDERGRDKKAKTYYLTTNGKRAAR